MSKNRRNNLAIPIDIIKLYRKLKLIRTIYLDTCIIGFLTDGKEEKECGELIGSFIKENNITCFISQLVLDELTAAEEVIDHKKMGVMVGKWLTSLNRVFNPELIKIKKESKDVKEFVDFLMGLGISKNDATHYAIAVFYDKDAFMSFNKKIFIERENKISKTLMLMKRKIPEFLDARELYKKLKILEKHNLI